MKLIKIKTARFDRCILPIVLFFLFTVFASHSFAQNAEDTTDGRFHDDLLDHLEGKWDVSSIAHGFSSTATIEAHWILNHQHMHLHFKGDEVIPWIGTPMEFDYFIGFNHNNNRYVIHGVSVFGNDDDDGFWYAYRNGNEIKFLQKGITNSDTMNVQTFTWEPTSNSWRIQSRPQINGKEGEVFLDMKLTAATKSSE